MARFAIVALVLTSLVGCSPAAETTDVGARIDAGSLDAGSIDAGPSDRPDGPSVIDAGADTLDAPSLSDAPASIDTAAPLVDAGRDAPAVIDTGADAPTIDAGSDAGVPATMRYCVDIDVSNTCVMSVSPTDITIPRDQIAYFCWINRSSDYPVDVWLSYGGGYTDLPPGSTWNEPPGHCLGPLAHDEYADITTACSSHRFYIHCL